MKRNLLKSLFAGAAILALGAGAAQAQTAQASATMEVRVEIVDGCTVNLIGGTQVDFSPRTQIFNDSLTREVNVNCTLGTGSPSGTPTPTTYDLRLPDSAVSGLGSPANRRMLNAAGDAVYYTVRQSNTCSSALWGDATAADRINGTFPTAAGGNRHAFNVCIDRQHNFNNGVAVDSPPLGLYADTLQIQLWY